MREPAAVPATPGDYTAGPPRKRMAAGVLFTDVHDRVLIVEPVYKDYWELPGGVVEADESPFDAARREVAEELGWTGPLGTLLVVDWVPPRPGHTEGLMLVFDGGTLTDAQLAALAVPPDELRGLACCPPAEAAQRLSPLLGRRMLAALAARARGAVAYLENGIPRR